jgi:acetyl esterase
MKKTAFNERGGGMSSRLKSVFVPMAVCAAWVSALAADGSGAFEPDRLIPYKTAGDGTLKLHVFFPGDSKPSDQRPAIIFFFGGGWNGGTPQQFYEQARFMAEHGGVAFAAECRIQCWRGHGRN